MPSGRVQFLVSQFRIGGVVLYDLSVPDWKVCFLRAEDIFPHQICALGKTVLASPPHMKWFVFQVYFDILRA